jgi:hypothetical protein
MLAAALNCAARDTMTGIFNERVRTLQVRVDGSIFAPPVVALSGGTPLSIEFDHLDEDRQYLRWRAVRCDANWQPSTLAESEWMQGFNESQIENYEFSRGTTVHYVHYSFNFPDDNISPTLSGNYLLEVYPESDPDDVWLQTRVMLSEQCAPIEASVTTQTDVDYNDAHQQLSVWVDTERAAVTDPFNDLTVMIAQNARCDNEVALRQPLRLSGRTAVYEHLSPLIFDAGNEYRRIEVSNVNYPGMGVEDIAYAAPYYNFKLSTDQSRAGQQYLYDQTQHGRFYVREYNSSNSDTEADYVVVHFSLDYPELFGWMIFLDGDMCQRRFDSGSIMGYNNETNCYEKVLLLKQGAYNYQYLAVKPNANSGSPAIIEGNKYQTDNEYLIKVYARGPLDRTDRLISVCQINSQP